jgi:hypothetical protein
MALLEHPNLGPGFEDAAIARRVHLAKLGVSGLKLSFTVVEHAGAAPGWVAAVPIRFRDDRIGLSAEFVDGVSLAHRLAFAMDEALLEASLCVPPGVSFLEDADAHDGEVTARYGPELLRDDVSVNRDAFALATAIHDARTVRDGVSNLAAARAMALPGALDEILPGVRALLRSGLLEAR